MSVVDEIRCWQDKLKDMPPPVAAIKTHPAVPRGRTFRQWDTAGRLFVWVNAGELDELPRAPAELSAPKSLPLFGIPVVEG